MLRCGRRSAGVGRFGVTVDEFTDVEGIVPGNDFVKFVSSIYLQNLCNAANERFYRMTRQRLKLELSEENDFVVRDFMNEGRVRSARTLSGDRFSKPRCRWLWH